MKTIKEIEKEIEIMKNSKNIERWEERIETLKDVLKLIDKRIEGLKQMIKQYGKENGKV